MTTRLGAWCKRLVDAQREKKAREAWNDGVPLMALNTAQYASERHAQYWTRWVGQLKMENPSEYSPACIPLATLVHKPFWTAAMRAHGKGQGVQYWRGLLSIACTEGNLSVVQSYADVFGVAPALETVESFRFLHPRVVGWQVDNGLISKAHVRDFLRLTPLDDGCSLWDAQEYVKGGPVMLAWMLDWVKLPDAVVDEADGYAWVFYVHKMLSSIGVFPGKRDTAHMASLTEGHQRTCVLAVPSAHVSSRFITAEAALAMLGSLYKRFGFDPQLMDALNGWCTLSDLQEPMVCAVLCHADKLSAIQRMHGKECTDAVEENADPVLMHMLELQTDGRDPLNVYRVALPFLRPALGRAAVVEQLDIQLLVD